MIYPFGLIFSQHKVEQISFHSNLTISIKSEVDAPPRCGKEKTLNDARYQGGN